MLHQGRIMEGAVNYHGPGFFKFALINATDPPTVHWSNDGSLDGQTTNDEPTAAVQRTVTRGRYSILLGDAGIANMTAIPASVFADNGDVRLRVWFGMAAGGNFEQLGSDQRLVAHPFALTAASVVSGNASIRGGLLTVGGVTGSPQAGMLRWDSSDLQGYNGTDWVSLTTDPDQPTELVRVGHPGNTADSTTYGAVANPFRIGKFEVTNTEYTTFLNAVAATDANSLYIASMASDPRGGITQSGVSGSFTYAVKADMGDKPVNFVSFWEACRFCNWLHNGQPTGAQDAGSTENGAYELNTTAVAANSVTRNSGARYFIPSEDEWYKAAYHQPAAHGGDTDDYWFYATQSNDAPTVATADATGNINNDDGNITNYSTGADWNGQDGNVTTVGSGGAGSASYYGAFDMAGNVLEWNEAMVMAGTRGLRGGAWDSPAGLLQSSFRGQIVPTIRSAFIGFRVAAP